MEQKLKIEYTTTIHVEHVEHGKIVLTNEFGDTYTSRSEDLMDFFHMSHTNFSEKFSHIKLKKP